jgi:hypothetical protein
VYFELTNVDYYGVGIEKYKRVLTWKERMEQIP